jgi:hypothetical protein
MVTDSVNLENDEFGYSCYVIVAPAPSELTEPLLEIERAAGQERAKIPAHVTVKGTMYGVTSLDGLIDEIRKVTVRHNLISLGTAGMALTNWTNDSVIMGFVVNPEIQALHDDLMSSIAPLGKSAYPDDPYKAHMSIVNQVGVEGAEIAKGLLTDIDFGDSLSFGVIDLMARRGPGWGGTWHRLERFELSAG